MSPENKMSNSPETLVKIYSLFSASVVFLLLTSLTLFFTLKALAHLMLEVIAELCDLHNLKIKHGNILFILTVNILVYQHQKTNF